MAEPSESGTLIDTLAEDFVARYRRGEQPKIEEYVERYPKLADQIRFIFPTLLMMERLKPSSQDTVAPPSLEFEGPQENSLPQFTDFRVIREVGHGGMGVVYEAEQVSLGRRVALKVLPPRLLRDERQQKRFQREARAAARLHHTNIVPVFGVGQENGLHYYAMQFIQGLGLDQVLTELKQLRQAAAAKSTRTQPRQPLAAGVGVVEAGTRGATRPAVMAADVAQSLWTGSFPMAEPFALLDSSDAPPTVCLAPEAPQAPKRTHRSTIAGSLSDTHSDSVAPLFGAHKSRSSSQIGSCEYWQSIARIGRQVAEALHYAHDQGIVHRDIKPGNLLLDMRGTVWVTDFGLAKADDQQDLTQTGDVLGTLRYMAPEQMDGRGDERSDIYSLGLTLYELLVFRPAFDHPDRRKLIHQVLNDSPPSLRSLDATIPRDLATIIHKAIERDPNHRYTSAQDLAEDLRRFLGDEPITARRLSAAAQFGRWCRKRPAVAGLTTALTMLLATAAVVAGVAATRHARLAAHNTSLAVQATRENEDAQTARRDAEAAQEEAEGAQRDAERMAEQERELREEAERQKERANANVVRARRAVDTYLTRVSDAELLAVPSLRPLRHQLLAAAPDFFAEFIREEGETPQLQFELAAAQYRLARIHEDLGDQPASEAAVREAIRHLEALLEQNASDREVAPLLAHAYLLARRHQDTVSLCTQTPPDHPEDIDLRRALAEAYRALADEAISVEQPGEARRYHRLELEVRQQLAATEPENARFQGEIAETLHHLGSLAARDSQWSIALNLFQEGLRAGQEAAQLAQKSLRWGRWVAISHRYVGLAQRQLGHQEAARESLERQADQWRRLVTLYPAVVTLRADHYRALQLLADQQRQLELVLESGRSSRDAREILEKLRRDAVTPRQLFELASVYASLASPGDPLADVISAEGEAFEKEEDEEEEDFAELAIETLRRAVDQGWADPAALENYHELDMLRARDDFQALAERVRGIADKLELVSGEMPPELALDTNGRFGSGGRTRVVPGHPDYWRHQQALATTYGAVGVIQTALKQFEEAEESLRQAIASFESWANASGKSVDEDPQLQPRDGGDTTLHIGWVSSRVALGMMYWQQSRFDQAHLVWMQCLADMDSLSERHREDPQFLSELSGLRAMIADHYGQIGLLSLVRDALTQNIRHQGIIGYRGGGNHPSDGTLSLALLLDTQSTTLRDYLGLLYPQLAGMGVGLWSEHAMFLRGTAFLDEHEWNIEHSIAIVEEFLKSNPSDEGTQICLAVTEFRNGRFEDAAARLSPFASSLSLQPSYLQAAIAWKTGRHERAWQFWNRGEREHGRRIREALVRGPLQHKGGVFAGYWWNFAYAWGLRRLAAETLADGSTMAENPWLHLIQARGYLLIGEQVKAEAELTRAAELAKTPEVWLALAELQAEFDTLASTVEATWQKAVEQAPLDPIPWIQRGRWHAERGERDKAEADFAQAASLTPDELNKFLEAGWWVVGPYPADLNQFCPPEVNPDPSVPQFTIDPQADSATRTIPWGRLSPSGSELRLSQAFPNATGTGYALAYLHAPEPRTAIFRIAGGGGIRLWLNGRLEFAAEGPVNAPHVAVRVPVALQPGRNTVLVRAALGSNAPLHVWLADTPADRAIHLAEQGRWQAARTVAFSEEDLQFPEQQQVWYESTFTQMALTLGDQSILERMGDRLLALRDTGLWNRIHATMPLLHFDHHLFRQHGDALAESLLEDVHLPNLNVHQRYRILGMLASHAALNGRHGDAADFLNEYSSPGGIALTALIQAAQGNTEKGLEFLDMAFQEADAVANTGAWPNQIIRLGRLRQAERILTGSDFRTVELLRRREKAAAEQWESADPSTYAFDHVLATYATHGNSDTSPAFPYAKRARRLLDLERFDEALEDLNRAIELAPDDDALLLQRAEVHAGRGQARLAAADLDAASERARARNPQLFHWHHQNDIRFRRYPEVLTELEALQPQRPSLSIARLFCEIPNGDMTNRSEDIARLRNVGLFFDYAGLLSLLGQDEATYQALCREAAESNLQPGYARLWLFVMGRPEGISVDTIMDLAHRVRAEASGDLRAQPLFATAQYRAGQYEAAKTTLLETLSADRPWQFRVPSWPLLAMVHHHLENADEARQWLDRSTWYYDLQLRDGLRPEAFGIGNIGIGEFGTFLLLHREAQVLIEGTTRDEVTAQDPLSE